MTDVLEKIRPRLGTTCEVAVQATAKRRRSKLYSVRDVFDPFPKVFVLENEDIGHFINAKIRNIDCTLSPLTFKAV